ncbi:MAG: twin-arginine translocation signal domain-containing protein [Acidobacteriia bacterium]|nr:twin-arginine translocation signal domain-containing protein [Terriglobia bacterium]
MENTSVSEAVAAGVSHRLRNRRKFLSALAAAAGAAGLATLGARKLKADSCDGNFTCDQGYHCTPTFNCKGFTRSCTPPYKSQEEEEEEVYG